MSTEVLVLGFDCVPSFSSGEVVSKRARVQSRSSECEPKGNLDGFLARLHAFPQNEGKMDPEGYRCGVLGALEELHGLTNVGISCEKLSLVLATWSLRSR